MPAVSEKELRMEIMKVLVLLFLLLLILSKHIREWSINTLITIFKLLFGGGWGMRENKELKDKIMRFLELEDNENYRTTRNIVLEILNKDNPSINEYNRMMSLVRYYLKQMEKEGLVLKKKKKNAFIWSLKRINST